MYYASLTHEMLDNRGGCILWIPLPISVIELDSVERLLKEHDCIDNNEFADVQTKNDAKHVQIRPSVKKSPKSLFIR